MSLPFYGRMTERQVENLPQGALLRAGDDNMVFNRLIQPFDWR